MIKISNSNIQKISQDYYESIRPHCVKRAEFFMVVINYLFYGSPLASVTNFVMRDETKRRCINTLLASNKVKMDFDFSRFAPTDVYTWVRTNHADLMRMVTELSSDVFLKGLILTPADQCYSEDNRLHQRYNLNSAVRKKQFSKVISIVLDYYAIFPKYAHDVSARISHHTCAYCNRIYTNTVVVRQNQRKRGIRPAFDHFYPHSFHPFLALSFFNLIPSCHYCNSGLKLAAKTTPLTHLHPYIDGFGEDCTFNFDIVGFLPDITDSRNYRLKFDMNIPNNDRYRQIKGRNSKEGNLNLFLLEEIYQEHRDIVGELRLKANKYNSAHGNSLRKLLSMLKSSKAEFYQFYFGNYFEKGDHHRRPMAKLTRDVVGLLVPEFK